MKSIIIRIVFGLFIFACQNEGNQNISLEESTINTEKRLEWWNEARFGMFIHWGIYSVPAGEYKGKVLPGYAEWIQCYGSIPSEEYQLYAQQFNPNKFDAKEWVKIAKAAGMKYLVITSKHHDGFCLWNSQYTNYDIIDRGSYKKDILKQLSEACREAGIKFGLYYSIIDWYHPSQYPDSTKEAPLSFTKILPELKSYYLTYMKNQLNELIENYHPAILWFDGEWVDWWTVENGQEVYAWLRERDPNLVINNRVGKERYADSKKQDFDYGGDFGTPEQEIPDTGLPGTYWESCMTMNTSWGYKRADNQWKSSEVLLHNLIDIVSKGGNYLLNVGPTPEGEIPAPSIKRLQEMGNWLEKNGQAIFATNASPFEKPDWGRYTQKDDKVYAHILSWPDDSKIVVPAMLSKAYTLIGHEDLQIEKNSGQSTVYLPKSDAGKTAPVIVLELEEERLSMNH